MHADLRGLHRVELIMNRRSRASQVEDFIDLDKERESDVVTQEFHFFIVKQMNNIVARTGMPEVQAREALEKTSPQKRLIEPEEVAAIAVFLAQDINRGITGQAINVDGGGVMS